MKKIILYSQFNFLVRREKKESEREKETKNSILLKRKYIKQPYVGSHKTAKLMVVTFKVGSLDNCIYSAGRKLLTGPR